MSVHGPWGVLGIDRTEDVKVIRRAYADRLKAMDVDRQAAEYAALRTARDTALRWAKTQEQAHPQSGGQAPSEGMEGDMLGARPDHSVDVAQADSALCARDEDALSGHRVASVVASPGPDEKLHELLFPDGRHSDAGFTYEEYEDAQALMGIIVADAFSGEVELQHRVDFWLADRLATAWPRSAPLVTMAADAFGWTKQVGKLEEGPAQAFLMARLRGMLFHEAVQVRGHWGYAAWKELSRPGPKGILSPVRAGKGEVRRLLACIREYFPELESYLDADRVAGWEVEESSSPWWIMRLVLIALFLLFQLLSRIA